MLFNRRYMLLAPLAVAACGFTPVYGPDGAGQHLLDRMSYAAPETRDDFSFVAQMETRLGRASHADFALAYRIETTEEGLAVTQTQSIARYNLVGTVAFSVQDLETGLTVYSGQLQNFTSFGASGTTVATSAARRDAYRRLMVQLANDVTTNILAQADVIAQ